MWPAGRPSRVESPLRYPKFTRLRPALWTLAALALAAACAPTPRHGQRIGTRSIHIVSSGLASALQGEVWYPAHPSARERPMFYNSMVWGHAAPGAKPAAGPPAATSAGSGRPLVLLAHGWRGNRFDLAWLGEALARKGYVTAAINMPDSDNETFQNAQAPKLWFRASMLSKVIDAVARSSDLGPIVDAQRVAVIGHSAGGSAALVLGGAKPDPERFAALFPEAAPVVPGAWRDPRVRALVALNPGTGPAFDAEGLGHVHVPLLVLSGSGDDVAPEASNAGFYAQNVEKASWTRFAGVNHYSFMSVCSPYAQLRRFGACLETHAEVDRAYVHARSLARIEAFLAQNLPLPPAPAAPTSPNIAPLTSSVLAHRTPAPQRR